MNTRRPQGPKTNPIPVRLEPDEASAIIALAEQNHTSKAEVLRLVVTEGLKAFHSKPKLFLKLLDEYRATVFAASKKAKLSNSSNTNADAESIVAALNTADASIQKPPQKQKK